MVDFLEKRNGPFIIHFQSCKKKYFAIFCFWKIIERKFFFHWVIINLDFLFGIISVKIRINDCGRYSKSNRKCCSGQFPVCEIYRWMKLFNSSIYFIEIQSINQHNKEMNVLKRWTLQNCRNKNFEKCLMINFCREFHELSFGSQSNHIRYNAREIFSKYLDAHIL